MNIKKRKQFLFLICWFAYTTTYICRLNFSAAMPELIGAGIFNNTQSALISSCLFITYGAGQIISGFLGDKMHPKNMIFGGLFISSLCNILLFFFCESFTATFILWGINGFAQSTVWSPILRVGSMYFEGKEKSKFGVNLSTTVPLGTLSSYAVSLLAIRFSGYKAVFLMCGLIVFAASFIWMFTVTKITKELPLITYSDSKTTQTYAKMEHPILIACIAVLLVIALPTAIHGALKDGVTGWVPAFIGEQFSVSTDFSLMLTMLLPIVNVTGAYIAKWLNKYLKNELLTCAVFFVLALAALSVLELFGGKSVYLSVVCLAIITNCMFAVNIMIITLIPLSFAKYGKTSTMTGILNASTYIGCGASMLSCGVILDKSGWSAVILMWTVMAAAAAAICIPASILWKSFKKKSNI